MTLPANRWHATNHESPITSMGVVYEGNYLVTGTEQGNVSIWDIATGHVFRTLTQFKGMCKFLAYPPKYHFAYIFTQHPSHLSKFFHHPALPQTQKPPPNKQPSKNPVMTPSSPPPPQLLTSTPTRSLLNSPTRSQRPHPRLLSQRLQLRYHPSRHRQTCKPSWQVCQI